MPRCCVEQPFPFQSRVLALKGFFDRYCCHSYLHPCTYTCFLCWFALATFLVNAVETSLADAQSKGNQQDSILFVPRRCILWQSVVTCRVLHKLPQSTGGIFQNHWLGRLLASPLVQACSGFVFLCFCIIFNLVPFYDS